MFTKLQYNSRGVYHSSSKNMGENAKEVHFKLRDLFVKVGQTYLAPVDASVTVT